jgi:hypothetical protein
LALSTALFSQSKQISETEQTHFSAEDLSVQKPAAIPKEIQEFLLRDDSVREVLASEDSLPTGFPSSWFLASIVHLGARNERDFVLVGQGPLLGANITRFWVFRQKISGYDEVVRESAHDLILSSNRWNGMREIELISATAVEVHAVVLRFNGALYQPIRDSWEPIN